MVKLSTKSISQVSTALKRLNPLCKSSTHTYCEAANFETVPYRYRIRFKTIQKLSYLCKGGISYDLKWKSHTEYLPCVRFDCVKNFLNVNSLFLLNINKLQSKGLMHTNTRQILISDDWSKLSTEAVDFSLPFE